MARKNGDLWLLKLADDGEIVQQLGYSTSASISVDQNLIDTTSKSSSRWSEHVLGNRTVTIDFEALLDTSASDSNLYSSAELMDSLINGTKIDFRYGSESSGDYYITGEGHLTSLTENAPHNGALTFSGTLQVTGAITRTAV